MMMMMMMMMMIFKLAFTLRYNIWQLRPIFRDSALIVIDTTSQLCSKYVLHGGFSFLFSKISIDALSDLISLTYGYDLLH